MPPVTDRLPDDPLVVESVEGMDLEIGTYGGQIKVVHIGAWISNDGWRSSGTEPQLHISHNEDANDAAMEAGFDTWVQLYNERDKQFVSVNRGNVDRIVSRKIENLEIYYGKIIGGEVDFAGGENWVHNFNQFPLLTEYEESGNYRVVLRKATQNSPIYKLNRTTPNEQVVDLFNDVRFRRALSIAIDRDEINEVIYFGTTVPAQLTAHPTSRLWTEENERAWAQHDPELANTLLDEIGLQVGLQRQVPARVMTTSRLPSSSRSPPGRASRSSTCTRSSSRRGRSWGWWRPSRPGVRTSTTSGAAATSGTCGLPAARASPTGAS